MILMSGGFIMQGVFAHPGHEGSVTGATDTRSIPGENAWNQGDEPEDWWGEIRRYHGHVGPWNVLGWRIGKAAMRELNANWGDHQLDIICHLPLAMPYTCMADGLTVATGNSIGRLDIRLAEEHSPAAIRVTVKSRKNDAVLEFWPDRNYLNKIETQPVEQLHALARETVDMDEKDLFLIK